jgi:ABC-type lipoprotein export system ATPase subunit
VEVNGMKITEVQIKKEVNGIKPLVMQNLKDVVLIAGANGSGKTRLMNLIVESVESRNKGKNNSPCEIIGVKQDSEKWSIINYSHSDLPLKSPDFPPYVIDISLKNLIDNPGFEYTAYNALPLLVKLIKYSEKSELDEFNEMYSEPLLGTKLQEIDGKPALFGKSLHNLNETPLSPGQQYLIRLCVAMYSNSKTTNNGNSKSILFLDEPESHLHPQALIKVTEKLRFAFGVEQIWIATHSLTLLAHFHDTSPWYMEGGAISPMGSNTDKVLKKLIGEENDRFSLYQFLTAPDAYACNVFALECLNPPNVVACAKENDPSTGIAKETLEDGYLVIDYGAGKGRLLSSGNIGEIRYHAYDIVCDNANECIKAIAAFNKTDIECAREFYYDSIDILKSKIGGKADRVIMVNVLHEIPPDLWAETMHDIWQLLNDDGELIVVECLELTIGEKPGEFGYFVLQPEAAAALFACPKDALSVEYCENNQKVVRYRIYRTLLGNANKESVTDAIERIRDKAFLKSKEYMNGNGDGKTLFHKGIAYAFWTHQYTNACCFLENPEVTV